MNPDQQIGHGHELKVTLFGIWKEDLRFPNGLHQLGVGKVQWFLQMFVVSATKKGSDINCASPSKLQRQVGGPARSV